MKKVFNSLFVIIAAMVTFAGCAKQEIDAPATSETKTVQFFANSIETKTEFGTPTDGVYPTLWSAEDKVKILVNLDQLKDTEKTVAVECSDDFKSARFKVELADPQTESYTFYSISPSTKLIGKPAGKLYVEIKDAQTPLATSVDKEAQLLFAKSKTTEKMPTSVDLNYQHLTAYGKFSLANLADESVLSIKIEAPEDVYLAGKWDYVIADDNLVVRTGNGLNTITLTTSSTTDIWFACAPVDMTGQKMTLTVTTEKGNFVKVLNFPADKERKFEAGKISKFTVDMAGIEVEEPEQPGETTAYYEKVTSAPTDWSGKYLLVVEDGVNKALSGISTTSTKYGLAEEVEINDAKIIASEELSAYEVVIAKASMSGAYTMAFDSSLLYWNSGNSLAVNSTESAKTSWTISLDNGKLSIYNCEDSARQLLWNKNSPRFACYTGKADDAGYYYPHLYKLVGGSSEGGGETPEPEPDPTPDPEPETPVYASLADLVAAGEPTADGSKVTVTLTDEKITDIDVTSSGYRNGVFLQVGDRKIEIYSRNVPEDWVVGGTISGTLTECVWKLYNTTWELCPANWSELTYEAPEGGSTEPEEPAAPVVATVAQFLAASEDDVVYEITGVITAVDNTQYGNFYLKDSTGEVYVYGLCSPEGEQKYWATAGVDVGDIITVRTVRTSHNGTPQGKNALYVSDVNFCINPTEINVNAEATTAEFDLSIDVGYTIEYPDGVTELSDVHNNDTATSTYTVEFPANKDAEIKTYEIKIVADASFILDNPIEGVEYARTVTIKQAAAQSEPDQPGQGGGDVQEYTYTWTATSGALGSTVNSTTTKTLNEVDWTIQRSGNGGYTGWGNNVIQIGSKNNPENLTLRTAGISGTVKSVSVACASYQAKHNISISVGDVNYVSKATPSWANNSVGTVVCEGNSTGDIEIKFTMGSGARALYIKSITIVYEN